MARGVVERLRMNRKTAAHITTSDRAEGRREVNSLTCPHGSDTSATHR